MKKIRKDSAINKRWSEIKKNGAIFNLLGLIPLAWGVLIAALFLWGVLVCFAEPNWYLDNSNAIFIKEITFDNFRKAIENFHVVVNSVGGGVREAGFWEMSWNSVWFTFGSTFMQMMATICFAYACARFEFRGRKLLYGFVILQMMLPVYGQTASNYSLLSKLGLVDSPLFLLAQGAGHGKYFLITYSFFRTLPTGYEEAAKMDGAGAFVIFGKVMLPLAKPIISALAIMTAIATWNNYSTILVMLPNYPNLATGLYTIRENAFAAGLTTPSYFAAIMLSILPVIVVFLIFNKQIMQNVSIGGLKG